MSTKKNAVAVVLVAFSVILSSPGGAAAGSTRWTTFGSGTATGRGWLGSPSISVESTTLRDPQQIRFVVSGDVPQLDYVSWSLDCFNATGYDTRYLSGSRDDAPVPFEKTVGGTWIQGYDYCELDVTVFSLDEGKLKLREQAKYNT